VTAADARSQKVAAGYVLGIVLIGIVVAAWLRGVARFVVPALLIALGAWFLARFLRKVREPLP
jgi:hypothetical protein